MKDTRRLSDEIVATLNALLRVRYPEDADQHKRDALIVRYLGSEVRSSSASPAKPDTIDAAVKALQDLPVDTVESIRCRCLFYACDDVIGLLVHKRIRADAIAREEATLYVQDRLQRDDFRRIRTYDAERGASFVTYIWQVVNNLLIDYVRSSGSRAGFDRDAPHNRDADDDASHAVSASTDEESLDAAQLHEMLKEVMKEPAGGSDAGSQSAPLNPIRERLRQHLNLSSKERVFLKALFQYDLTINEIRALPGFEMNVNEAYRFYYGIMERLLTSFKDAGVLDSLRSEVSTSIPRVTLQIGDREVTIPSSSIVFLEQWDRNATRCYLDPTDRRGFGIAAESFSKLSKSLSAYFTTINTKVAVADSILASSDWSQEGVLTISGLDREFKIAKPLWAVLKSRAKKSTRSLV